MSLPIWSAGMLGCCVKTCRVKPQREGFECLCMICKAPLRIRNGAWEAANYAPETIAPDVHNTRIPA